MAGPSHPSFPAVGHIPLLTGSVGFPARTPTNN